MSVRAWVRQHTAEGRVAARVQTLVGDPSAARPEPMIRLAPSRPERTARLEYPGRAQRVRGQFLARSGLRFDPGRRAPLAVGIAAVAAVLLAGGWLVLNRPHRVGLPIVTVSSPSARSSTQSASSAPAASGPVSSAPVSSPSSVSTGSGSAVVVDVVGKVVNPGIYRLLAGSRIDDAVRAAGGALPGVDLSTINRALVLFDGEQVAVGVPGAPAPAHGSPGDGGSAGSASGPVNLNTASAAQLDALPGVGPVLVEHIIAWRTQHGRFTSIDQLREVSGIGEAKFADLKSLVTV